MYRTAVFSFWILVCFVSRVASSVDGAINISFVFLPENQVLSPRHDKPTSRANEILSNIFYFGEHTFLPNVRYLCQKAHGAA